MTTLRERIEAEALEGRQSAVQSPTRPVGRLRRPMQDRAQAVAGGIDGESADQAVAQTGAEPAPRRPRPANRKPFGVQEQRLAVEERPGFRRYWFNDEPGRVDRAREAGYEHVLDKDGKPMTRIVGKTARGDGLIAYLMEIPIEWYREDMEASQADRDAMMASIRRGNFKPVGNSYIPKQGITVSEDRR